MLCRRNRQVKKDKTIRSSSMNSSITEESRLLGRMPTGKQDLISPVTAVVYYLSFV